MIRRLLQPFVVALPLALALTLLLGWIAPLVALADNCADPADCYGFAAGAAMAAGGIGAMLAARHASWARQPGPPSPEEQRELMDTLEPRRPPPQDYSPEPPPSSPGPPPDDDLEIQR